MKNTLLLFGGITFAAALKSQTISQHYNDLIHVADSLYKTKEYKKSALTYSEAFKSNGWKGLPNHRYAAACSWALAGVPDSAFFNLERIVSKTQFKNYKQIINDVDLVSLHDDQRWKSLTEAVKQNKDKAEAGLNKPLVQILDSIYDEDQKYRLQLREVEKKQGRGSKGMDSLWHIINEKDASNLLVVTSILDKYGWLGPDVIGNNGNTTLFLVIQHSNQKTQEKYLPLMRQAVKAHNAQASSLALLEDRVALGQGKKQIYGSQISVNPSTGKYYVLPLEDPDNVDKRRLEMGMGPLAEYTLFWNLKWDIEQYKKDLLSIEAEKK